MIENLISRNEGKTLEFKENTKSLSKIINTIIAFANTAGGTLIIGIKDSTITVKGLDVINETPILDIKPYTQQYDKVDNVRVPDWVNKLDY